jgi:hypothetical protein
MVIKAAAELKQTKELGTEIGIKMAGLNMRVDQEG